MEIIGLQWDLVWENKEANFRLAREMVAASDPEGGSLLVLPEMFATGFTMNAAAVAEEPGGETSRFLADLAREHGVWVLGGVVRRGLGGRALNAALVCAPSGEEVACYVKMHPFRPAGEAEHYDAGGKPVAWEWQGAKTTGLICYDLRFPEVFRFPPARGAEIIVVVASWPVARVAHWHALLQARAIENQAYVVGVNRCGKDPAFAYPGASTAFAPGGEPIALLGEEPGFLRIRPDLKALREYRARLPFLDDLRTDLFAPDR